MPSFAQSVTLLRKNKRAIVDAFKAIGFDLGSDYENIKASDFPSLVYRSCGLYDICLACAKGSDKYYFTQNEWEVLSATEQQQYVKRGLRVRADGKSFIIASTDLPAEIWGKNGIDVKWLDNNGISSVYRTYESKYQSDKIVEQFGENLPCAALSAIRYKAFNAGDNSGIADATEWALPAMGILCLIGKYIKEINIAFSRFWASEPKLSRNAEYWSSNETDANNACCVKMTSGLPMVKMKSTRLSVRPVAAE